MIFLKPNLFWSYFFSVQWTVGGTKGKKKVKQGKGSDKKNATKKKVNKATASGSSDGDSSAESSAPEEGECPRVVGSNPSSAGMWLNSSVSDHYVWQDPQNAWIWDSVSWGVDYTDNQDVLCHSLRLGDSLAHPPLYLLEHCAASKLLDRFTSELETCIENFKSFWIRVIF